MDGQFPRITGVLSCALALAFGAACVDPFKSNTPPKPGTGGSPPPTGTGGTPPPTGTGGANPYPTGGTGGGNPTGGAGGGNPTGGAGGGNPTGGAGGAGGAGGGGTPDAAPPPVDKPPTPDFGPDRLVKYDTMPVGNAVVKCPADPEPPDGEEETCPAILTDINPWLPVTPAVRGCMPPAHPETECRFYQFAWQNFMLALQPGAQGKVAFLSWNTIDNTFGAGAGTPTPDIPEFHSGVTQAGGRQVLVDQAGHPIYYAIHINKAFVNFVNAYGLTSSEAIKAISPQLAFPDEVVELKSAWQVVSDTAPPANFLTTKAKVPVLKVMDGKVVEDRGALREVTLALLAIHVVYTLPGHPEFIWSTFEHVNAQGVADVAPSARANPENTGMNTVINANNFVLYRGGTTAARGNLPIVTPMFDEATQTYMGQTTPIYRAYTASKSNTTVIDDDVVEINEHMTELFTANRNRLMAGDKRPNYRMVGAVWQDRPDRTMFPDRVLVNADNLPMGGDNPASITGGEDRLSSTAMESFTQQSSSFPNCFHCHDTRANNERGVPVARDMTVPKVLDAKLINVSHVFSEVVRLGM